MSIHIAEITTYRVHRQWTSTLCLRLGYCLHTWSQVDWYDVRPVSSIAHCSVDLYHVMQPPHFAVGVRRSCLKSLLPCCERARVQVTHTTLSPKPQGLLLFLLLRHCWCHLWQLNRSGLHRPTFHFWSHASCLWLPPNHRWVERGGPGAAGPIFLHLSGISSSLSHSHRYGMNLLDQ